VWWTAPLRRTRVRRPMRWRAVLRWRSCTGFGWLRACRWTRLSWPCGLCLGGFGTRGGLLRTGTGLRTSGVACTWSGCRLCRGFRARRGPGLRRTLRTILCVQRGRQRSGETAEEESMQQPGLPCFHRHSFPSQVLEERRKRKPIPGERQRAASDLAGRNVVCGCDNLDAVSLAGG
jgi:hypothetical protein